MFTAYRIMIDADDLYQVKQSFRNQIKSFLSVPMSLVLADVKGNIAFAMLSSSPVRKTQTYPYVAERVLDGRVSHYDWISTLPFDQVPFIINPASGFFTTANHRITPENSKYDVGGA